MPFLLNFLLQPLGMYTATGRLIKKLCCSFEAHRRPFLTALALRSYPCWTPVLAQCPHRKKRCLKGYWHSTYPLETLSPTIALQERPACMLHSVQHALTVYIVVQSWVQCSMLCVLLCAPHHWHNANANQHVVRVYSQYIIVRAVVGGGKVFPQLLQSCNIMPHCACSILCSLVWDVWISTHYAINLFGPTVGHIFKTKTKHFILPYKHIHVCSCTIRVQL